MNDDAVVAHADAVLTVDVLSNDKGDIVVSGASNSTNGTVVVRGNVVQYRPRAGFIGADAFVYTVVDESGTEHHATVTVSVLGTNVFQSAPADPLALTGSSTGRNTMMAMTAIIVGFVLVAASGRRRKANTPPTP